MRDGHSGAVPQSHPELSPGDTFTINGMKSNGDGTFDMHCNPGEETRFVVLRTITKLQEETEE